MSNAGFCLPHPARPGGYRDYPEQTTGRLRFIRDAQSAGLTLAEVRSVLLLRDDGEPPCDRVATLIAEHLVEIDRRLAEMRNARRVLRSLARRAAAVDPTTCAQEDICAILKTPRSRARLTSTEFLP